MKFKEIVRKMFNKTDCLKLKRIIQCLCMFPLLYFLICWFVLDISWAIALACILVVVFVGLIIKIVVS